VTLSCPVREAAERDPHGPALRWKGDTWTWGQLDGLVEQASQALRSQGVQVGQRVPVKSANDPSLLVLFHALGRVGGVLMPLNVRFTSSEVERCLVQVPAGPAAPGVRAALFTSGTTGRPRLVELTEENFRASAAASAANLGRVENPKWLGTLPLFHIGGLAMAHRCAVDGAGLLLEDGFDPERACALFDLGVTHASLVPTTLQRLLDARGDRPFAGVRAVLVGGGPTSPALLARARAAGLPVLQTYGLTEACSQVTTERPGEADGATAGPPLPGIDVRIVDDRGVGVEIGREGDIEVSGPTLGVGLGPWLRTGDVGRLDERGRLIVLSRRVDLIVSGGENVYAAEVEAVLQGHPEIVEVAVVPRSDARWGQVPVAYLVLRRPVSEAALIGFAKERLASFKVPKEWWPVPELPRNAMGKIERRVLVQRAADSSRAGAEDDRAIER
jgi:o-succinylbenzoate---CoA ligase